MTVGAGDRQFVIRVDNGSMFAMHTFGIWFMTVQTGGIRVTLLGNFVAITRCLHRRGSGNSVQAPQQARRQHPSS
ncbi:Uncharacterised protein [Shigella flexneri]|nr:Uncharacterised protein [Shigella flexneri]